MITPVVAMNSSELEPYLSHTWFVDGNHPAIIAFARQAGGGELNEIERAIRLFYAVRDGIRYNAYSIGLSPAHFRASNTLAAGYGWCVTKACLLAAGFRAAGIPCRLGYANVRNHLATIKLKQIMATDVFYYHGYNEFYLEGRWVKATVAFNASLCEKARLKPLDWDGRHDSLYHPYDLAGNRHMEYLHNYGHFAEVPQQAIVAKFQEAYPLHELFKTKSLPGKTTTGDFEAEIEAEAADAARQSTQ